MNERNERTETHACDLIERQAARLAKCPFDGLNDYVRGWNDACDAIADNAPSAQLELANNSQKVDKENGDLIERQAAIDALEKIGSLDTEADKKYARSIFEALPSAQPIEAQRAYFLGMIDGVKECTARVKKVNEEINNARTKE